MTVSTFFAGTGDGYAEGQSSTYATARGAAATANSAGATTFVGQSFASPTYFLDECFEMWDTSAIGDRDVVNAAVISLWGSADHSTTDFTINARLDAWSGTAVTGDYIAGASFPGSFTLLATFATSGWTTGAYNDFTDVALTGNVNKTGNTGVVFTSDRFEAGTAPSGNEYVDIASANTAGTTNDPKLVVTHSPLKTRSLRSPARQAIVRGSVR